MVLDQNQILYPLTYIHLSYPAKFNAENFIFLIPYSYILLNPEYVLQQWYYYIGFFDVFLKIMYAFIIYIWSNSIVNVTFYVIAAVEFIAMTITKTDMDNVVIMKRFNLPWCLYAICLFISKTYLNIPDNKVAVHNHILYSIDQVKMCFSWEIH